MRIKSNKKSDIDMAVLPQRQRDVLILISKLTDLHGYPPTLAELAKAMGLKNRMTVHQHVHALKKKGFVHWEPGLNRSLRVLPSISSDSPSPGASSLSLEESSSSSPGIPLLGKIAAGGPIDAIYNQDRLEIDAEYAKKGCFALMVKGDSMVNDGILDGDYVIVKPNPNPRNGEIVVALLEDGSATLKHFYKEKGQFRLEPANDDYEPIVVSGTHKLEIQGVMVGLFRKN